jgi:Ca2+/H+ antiporter
MLGSILSDILFVLGGCLFSSAWRDPILKLNTAVSGALSSLMIITAVALILPTALYSTVEATSSEPQHLEPQILAFSRGTAFVLLVLYTAYLHFEFTRKDLFDPQPLGTVRRHDSSASRTSPATPHFRSNAPLPDLHSHDPDPDRQQRARVRDRHRLRAQRTHRLRRRRHRLLDPADRAVCGARPGVDGLGSWDGDDVEF